MSKLTLKTQNNKGGNPQYKDSIEYAVLFPDCMGNAIICDSFQGEGKTYQRREHTQIRISRDNLNFTFENFDSLIKALKKGTK